MRGAAWQKVTLVAAFSIVWIRSGHAQTVQEASRTYVSGTVLIGWEPEGSPVFESPH